MLIGWIAAVIGIIIVVFSLNRLIREIRRAGIPNLEDQSFSDTFYKLLSRVDQLGEDLDDINQTFYTSVERLEKRMEALEKKATIREPLNKSMPLQMPDYSSNTDSELKKLKNTDDMRMAEEIRKMLNEGKDTQQVAKKLNLGVGEVELIQRLRPEQKREG